MITYLTTQEETRKAANRAKQENYETYVKESSFDCEHGESYACYLIDLKTLNTIQIFVECEACHNQY